MSSGSVEVPEPEVGGKNASYEQRIKPGEWLVDNELVELRRELEKYNGGVPVVVEESSKEGQRLERF